MSPFASSFGKKWPSKARGGKTEKRNPLGEKVTPRAKPDPKFGERIAPRVLAPVPKKNPLGERVAPAVKPASGKLGERVVPRVIQPERPKSPLGERVVPAIIGPAVRTKRNVVMAGPPGSSLYQPPLPPVEPGSPRSGIAMIGRFVPWPWRQHPDEAYFADAIESLGLRVFRVNQDLPTPPILGAEWAIFTGHPSSLARFESWRRTHPTVIWTLDWLPDYPERKPMIQAGKRATLFLSSDQYDWREIGVMNQRYLPGACEARVAPFEPKPTISCAFMGSIYSERRKKIVSIVKKLGGVAYDHPGMWKYGEELSKFVQTVKVVVGDNARNDVQGYWSTRNYIIPGAGGFLLTPRVPGLELQFALDKEIAVYDSIDELEAKLVRWISNDAEREEVRRAGFKRARKDHTWQTRAKSLIIHLASRINATP